MFAVMRFEEAEEEAKAADSLAKATSERVTAAEKQGAQAAPTSWSLGVSQAKVARTVSWKEGTMDNERQRGEPDYATRVAQVVAVPHALQHTRVEENESVTL